ncbi:ATP-binding protein [Halomonas sp. M20]|uniref:ATP-binding protein n=1 Tax=Halomonas sp. M20 TaxID=2763264 RepID=UPI001D0AB303|nr:ATP-binding protein [Halomonas sp. M20]
MSNLLDTRRWLWRAMTRTSLIPLLLVAVGVIGMYLATYKLMYEHQVALLKEESSTLLNQALEREARLMQVDLQAWERQGVLLANAAQRALMQPISTEQRVAETRRHRREASGIYYTPRDDGQAASYYSAITPEAQRDHRKIAQLATLDPLMQELVENDPRLRQVYINTFDSYNRLWPWFDAGATYDSHMDIPSYNFYFLADARNNPERQPVWTDAYLDPAGSGWMISLVAPFYRDEFLEGVAGIDITLKELTDRLLSIELPWTGYAVLVGRDGSILALPSKNQQDFRRLLKNVKAETGAESVTSANTESINLMRMSDTSVIGDVLAEASGSQHTTMAGEPRLLAWRELVGVNWTLLAIIDENATFVTGDSLSRSFRELGIWMLVGLLLFYLLTLMIIRRRTLSLNRMLVDSLQQLQSMAAAFGDQRRMDKPRFQLREFSETGDALVKASRAHEGALGTLAAEKERLRLALEASEGSVWEYDIVNDRLMMHDSMFHLLGLAPVKTLPLATFQACIHPQDLPRFESQRRRVMARKMAVGEIEMRLHLPDGGWLWVLTRGSVFQRNENGEALCATGVVLNIHQRKHTTAELERTRDEARWAQRAQSRLFSRVSHELRTPLGIIIGFTDLLQGSEASRLDAQTQCYLGEVVHAAERLDALLEDVLQLASLESGEMRLECEVQSAQRCLRRNMSQSLAHATRCGIQLELATVNQAGWILADRQRLDQVVQNLIDNAIKYNRPGGWIRLSTWVEADSVCLEVADNGHGIAEDDQEVLFRPFSRLGMEHSEVKGSGLGLAICQELVRRMQGRIEVSSMPGQGSRFQVWLPQVNVQACQAAVIQALPPGARLERPLTLLLISKDEETHVRMEVLAEQLDYLTLLSTRHRTRAMRLINEQPPQLLLCDATLGAGQAVELLHRCQRLQGKRQVYGYWIGPAPMPAGFHEQWQPPPRMEKVWSALCKASATNQRPNSDDAP